MARNKKPLPLLEGVTITNCAAEGKAMTKINDMVVFVPFAVPGDVVDIQIRKKRRNYCEGDVVKFIEYSNVREKPFCPHFGICGGCKWQILPYNEQLKMKQQQVVDQLIRIGKVEIPTINNIIGSEKITEYRNKLEFGCSSKRWFTKEEISSGEIFENTKSIGFHITGVYDKIFPIEVCKLMHPLQNDIRNSIRDYCIEHDVELFDQKAMKGLLRNLMLRCNNNGEWMLLIQFFFENDEDKAIAERLMSFISERFPQIISLLYVDNQKCNDTINDLNVVTFKGQDYIFENLEDLKFKIGAKSFFQTNSLQTLRLYKETLNAAALKGNEVVYDLYTGTGTIANFLARKAKQVIGIEYVPEAIEDAKINSEINEITNTRFFAGDMKDILNDEFVAQYGRPDVIVTDPPRAGMHSDVIQTILNAEPKRIVYVSCNPATQARDLSDLSVKYRVVSIQPVDMFPHTPHVENIATLELR